MTVIAASALLLALFSTASAQLGAINVTSLGGLTAGQTCIGPDDFQLQICIDPKPVAGTTDQFSVNCGSATASVTKVTDAFLGSSVPRSVLNTVAASAARSPVVHAQKLREHAHASPNWLHASLERTKAKAQ
ncbi:hypothetical protein HK104_002659 [Borealophlyctis nickersoniae]|nr:hypothetical protein HK104_002659 [Borealophlyctis nickersoniae]